MRDEHSRPDIQAALDEFEGLDRDLAERLKAGDLPYPEKVRVAKNRIKDLLVGQTSGRFTGRLQTALRRVRTNEGYNIDRLYDLLGPGYFQEADDRDYMVALFTEGTADYVGESFFRRRRQAGAVVISQHLPTYVQQRLEAVRECYSLGLFSATLVFCRALVEAAMFEALKRRGRVSSRGRVVDQAEYKPVELRQRIRPFLSSRMWERVCGSNGIVKLADHVLHAKGDVRIGEKEAYDAIKAAFALVEELFA